MSWKQAVDGTRMITIFIVSYLTMVAGTCSKDELSFKETRYATQDFAIIGRSKEISLCVVPAKFDTCNIQWHKDGEPLRESDNISFRNNKQQLHILEVGTSDNGNYSCEVSNANQKISRSLVLETYVHYSGEPFNLGWDACKFPETPVGADYVSVECKFEVGPNPSDVLCDWLKQNTSAPKGSDEEWLHLWEIFTSGTKYNDTHCREHLHYPVCGRSENTTSVFLCLTLYNITKEDFGTYLMTVNNGLPANFSLVLTEKEDTGNQVDSGLVIAIALCIVAFIAVVFIISYLVKVDVQLYFKDKYSKRPTDDGKRYDAYISHTDNDLQFVLCLKRHLEKRGYHVYVPAIDTTPGECTLEEIGKALDDSRRFVMVLSPQYVGANFAAYEAGQFVDRMSPYKSEVISILFKSTQVEAENCREILKYVLKTSRVVHWPEFSHDEEANMERTPETGTEAYRNLERRNSELMVKTFKGRVYKELLLGMPPKPKGDNSEHNGDVVGVGSSYRMNGNHLNGV